MVTFPVGLLEPAIVSVGYPFVRILAFVATEPVLGNRTVPRRVKIALALFLALLVAPTLPMPTFTPGSPPGLLALLVQILIGVAMGFAARIVVSAAEMAGQLAGLQMGLGFAVFFDPQGSGQTPTVAQFYGIVAILVLLATNGHHVVLAALAESFRVLPVGDGPLVAAGFRDLVLWGGTQIFTAGVMMSLPVVGALLIANIAIGVLTRAAPQLNIFAVGFPITLLVGILILYVSIPLVVPMLDHLNQSGYAAIERLLHGWRPTR
jgi:flagellar biosynthetic protein FliR